MPALEQVKVETGAEEYLNEEQLLALPMFAHLKQATLARWRSEGKGPRYTISGRKPFYRLSEVYRWLREEEDRHERQSKVGKMALQIQGRGQTTRRFHRLGGHKTK